jgi:hypothetical protein
VISAIQKCSREREFPTHWNRERGVDRESYRPAHTSTPREYHSILTNKEAAPGNHDSFICLKKKRKKEDMIPKGIVIMTGRGANKDVAPGDPPAGPIVATVEPLGQPSIPPSKQLKSTNIIESKTI